MNKLKKYLIGAGCIAFLALIGSLYWYFAVYKTTPEYALKRIEYALETHDKDLFDKYVDINRVLDSSYDAILKSLMNSDATMSEETKVAALDAIKILKNPVLHGFQKAVDSYVANGSWDAANNKKPKEDADFDVGEIIAESGIKNITFHGIDEIIKKSDTEAVAMAKVYSNELEKEFVFEIILNKVDNSWKVVEIGNFEDYVLSIGKMRREKIQNYIEESRKIWSEHEETMRDADFNFQRIMGEKSLGKQGTRGELKALMEDTVAADWKARKSELEALSVPKEVMVLHKLRLKIADLHIEYAEGYTAWLDDKKAATLRVAEDKIKQAKILEHEATLLEKRIGAK